ncbi:hypothetical protein [Paenarthrobacter sp. YIM B13468]|uniref:hypothetical protein n=1 Tax=Paenarthrobacter sp. YIM B13468 TaxID=3366295 RepID=UPI00367171F6
MPEEVYDSIALSLWFATVYVVIEGLRDAGISNSEVAELLGTAGSGPFVTDMPPNCPDT